MREMESGSDRGRSRLAFLALFAVGLLLVVGIPSGSRAAGYTLEDYQGWLLEHSLFDLEPGSSHQDSLRAINYELFMTPERGYVHDPACIALVEVLTLSPPDSTAIESHARWGRHQKRYLRNLGSLIEIRIIEVLGCRDMELKAERLSIHTLNPSSHAFWHIAGHWPQFCYPGVHAYARIAEERYYEGELMVRFLFIFGVPDHESSLFHLQDRVRPLFEEFARDLEALEIEDG
ncbi:MAG: hypothetical protein JW819_03760 [Candidatus Krumholzibacteriota bacterium]|jgi:hypothetical protein|nr:hypothetical protein [Candidatus Krumholzibacteriota bacterium]